MFDVVSKHKRLAQIILFLLAIPFVFFGVDSYFGSGAPEGEVATVSGEKITRTEFTDSIREQQDQMRRQMGRGFDPAMFDNPEVRFVMLEQLINQRLMTRKAADQKFRVSDAQLQQFIAAIPAIQEDGKFSPERYRQWLAAQNMTPPQFEQRLRQDLLLGSVQEPIASANIVARTASEKYLGLLEQQREVSVAVIEPGPYAKEIRVTEAQVREHYDKNLAAFQTPEQARIEYALLTLDSLMAQASVDPNDVRKQYDANVAQYTANEERSAAHVLIAVKPDAKEEEKSAAKKLADDVYAKAKANPAKFGDLAKQYSTDTGSAQQGGDLGSFARGTMVKPFDDAVFGAKAGDLLAPVQSDFGWHIIKVNSIRPARTRTFEEVKAQIEADMKRQKAAQKFATSADQFQNLVYEQADNLAAVGKTLDIKIETTPLITRAQAQALGLGNPKFVEALFSPESIQSKRNTEAIEVAPNTLIAGRIIEYKPAAPRPFDEVKDEIRTQLVRQSATDMAEKVGLEKLKLLEDGKGNAGLTFAKPTLVGRGQVQAGLSPDVLTRVFLVNPDKLPAYTGALNERGGYSIVRVSKVVTPEPTDKSRIEQASARLGDQLGRELLLAYLGTLRAKADVKVNQANLDKK